MTDGNDSVNSSQGAMRVRMALVWYVAALFGVFCVIFPLAAGVSWFPGWIAVVAYLGAGVALNRGVFRRLVEWHPVWATIDNISSSKLRMLLFWPVNYPVLFMKLGVQKYL